MEFLQASSLTTGLDVASDFAATSANDTFVALDVDPTAGTADASTFNTGDDLDGGAGTDTLVIRASLDTAAHTNGASVSTANIENLSIYNNTNNDAYDVDASLMAGVTDVFVNGGNATTTVSGLDSTPNLHLISTNEDATVTFADATVGAGTADAVTVLANRVATSSAVTATYDRVETINLVAAGTTGSLTATTDRSLTISAADLETLNVTGDADIYVTTTFSGAAADIQTSTFDASAAGGKVTASLTKGASDLVSITMSGQDDYLAYNSALTEDAIIDGGDGVDTLELGASLSYGTTALTQTAGTGVSGFEVLRLAAGVTVDARAFVNNEGLTTVIAEGAGSYTKSGITSLTQLATGAFTASLATDGAADELNVTLGGLGVVSTLTAADMESINFVSAGLGTNEIQMSAAGSLDLTSVTVTGTTSAIVDVAGVSLATVDASGVSGLGRTFTLEASESEADMTVTGSSVTATTEALAGDTITTGEGDDTITTGANRDVIIAGDGDNVVDAGDGNNSVTTGRDDDTITVGDGNNTIIAGVGDDTVTVGGTATSVNSINLGNGDDTLVSGDGVDTVTLGAGDDNVSTGGGADKIYMSDFDDDDVVNGGAGSDTLSVDALVASTTAAPLQIQATARFIDVTPGTSGTASPQFTDVETVYMQAILAIDNSEATASTNETIDFAASSGITNLYLEIDDPDTQVSSSDLDNSGLLTLSEIDAAAIHLVDRESTVTSSATADSLGELVIVGAGQSSLTVKGYDFDGGTDITVSDVDAFTLTAYQDSTLVDVGETSYGDVEADDAETVTVTQASTTAAINAANSGVQTLTLASLSADGATAIALNAGSYNQLTVTNAVSSSSDALDTLTLTASDDGTLLVADVDSTNGDLSSVVITLGVNSAITVTNELDVAEATAGTITVGAASTLTMSDLIIGGAATTITGTASSTVDIDTYGKTGLTASTITISGRGDLTPTFAIDGDTSVNVSGWTDVNASVWTVTTTGDDDMGFTSNALPAIVNTGNGVNTITTGAGADFIAGGSGIDTIRTNDGIDNIAGGGGADIIIAGDGADIIAGGAGADTLTGGDGADKFEYAVTSAVAETTGTGTVVETITGVVRAGDVFALTETGVTIPTYTAIAGDTPTTVAAALAALYNTADSSTDAAASSGALTITTGTAASGVALAITSAAGVSDASVSVSGTTVTGFDSITDYTVGDDTIVLPATTTATTAVPAAGGTAAATSAVAVDGNGLVSFAAADDTLAEKVTALAADTATIADGSVVLFVDGDDAYLYIANDTSNDSTDALIKLVGGSDLDTVSISSGVVTIS